MLQIKSLLVHGFCRLSHLVLVSQHSGSLIWRWVASCRTQSCLSREQTNPWCKGTSTAVLGELMLLEARSTSRSHCTNHFKSLIPLFCPTPLLRSCWQITVLCLELTSVCRWAAPTLCLPCKKDSLYLQFPPRVQNHHLLVPIMNCINLPCPKNHTKIVKQAPFLLIWF